MEVQLTNITVAYDDVKKKELNLEQAYNDTEAKYQNLSLAYKDITTNYQNIWLTNNDTVAKYGNLSKVVYHVEVEYRNLSQVYNDLQISYTNLSQAYSHLKSKNERLDVMFANFSQNQSQTLTEATNQIARMNLTVENNTYATTEVTIKQGMILLHYFKVPTLTDITQKYQHWNMVRTELNQLNKYRENKCENHFPLSSPFGLINAQMKVLVDDFEAYVYIVSN